LVEISREASKRGSNLKKGSCLIKLVGGKSNMSGVLYRRKKMHELREKKTQKGEGDVFGSYVNSRSSKPE